MKSLKTKIKGKFTVDPTLDERYGDGTLFPEKIERIKHLLEGIKLAPTLVKVKKQV